jgi:hypothetical protein
MATVSSVPADLSSDAENLDFELLDCALNSLLLVPFCRRMTFECTIGGRWWLLTVIADDRDMTGSDGTTTRERLYTWEAGEWLPDPDHIVEFEEFARYVFETPLEAYADATQVLAEYRAVPEPISAGVA